VNLRGGKALIFRLWQSYLASRGFFWVLALGHLMPILIYMFVWMTAASQNSVGGFDRDAFVVYYLAMMVLHELTYPSSNYTVGDVIRTGGFSTWLLRPLHPIYEAIGTDFASKAVGMPFTILVALGLWAVLRPAVQFTAENLFLFFLAMLLAYTLRFILAYALALLALWSQRADALLNLNDTLLFLFAGQVAPLALLPQSLQNVALLLPYRYMLGFPVEVLMGRLSQAQLGGGFLGLGIWILIALLLHQLVWKRGLRHYSAVGG
jgi:ABC-2 type transport system permease protein